MKRNFILIIIVIIHWHVNAQQPSKPEEERPPVLKEGDIIGIIQDSTTQGVIEYATVGLYKNDSTLVSGVVTDVNGKFMFRDIQAGDYYLDANFLGYSRKKIPVSVIQHRPGINLGEVILHPDITQIDEVQIVAQSQRIEYKIDKKVVNIAQDISSAGGTLASALENTPSVEVDVEGNVTLRGSGNFQLLIDGRPSVIQGSDGLQQIPASAVQSLEIITSPSAKYDPDGNAGIINVIMKKQKNSGIGGVLNASVGTGNKYTGDFLFNIKRNKLNYFIGGEYSEQHFYMNGEAERRTLLNNSTTYILSDLKGNFIRKSMSLKSGFDYSINDKSTISLSASIGNRDSQRNFNAKNNWYTFPATKDSFFIEENRSSEHDDFYNVNLDFQKRYDHPDHHLQASVYFSAQKESEKEQDHVRKTNNSFEPLENETGLARSRSDQPEKELRFELDFTKPVGSGKLETGLQSRWDNTDADYIYENFHPLGNEWLRNDTISNTLFYLDALQSGYLTYSGPLGKLFDYQVGLRAEYDNRLLEQKTTQDSYRYEKLHLFPSLHLTKKISEKHQVQFTYSRRIQRPRQNELNPFKDYRGSNNIFYGNPKLKPEFTNAFELNYQYTFEKGFVSLETYYRATYDKITQINGLDSIDGRPVFVFTIDNADRDYALGMELMTNLDVAKWWQLNLTGNLFRYQLNGKIDGEDITRVSNSWRTNVNTLFKMKWDTRFQITAIYNGPSNTLQGKRAGFFVTNVALRKEMFKKQLTLALNVRDIFSTGKFSFTSEGSNFYAFNVFRREAPVVTLNLTYRLNNYKQNGNRRDNGGPEGGGGMDDVM